MPLGVNLQDCRDSQLLRFVVQMSGTVAGDTVQVWATDQGADCSQSTSRTGSIQTCYQLNVAVPVIASTNVDLPVKDILKGLPNTGRVDENGCRRLLAATAIDVQFLYFRGSTTGASTVKDDASINFKTQGPTPLNGISLQPGNGHLNASFEAVGEGGVADVTKVYAYCDRNPVGSTGSTSTTCSEAGTTDDSGTDSGTDADTDGGCTTSTVAAGDIPAPNGIASNGVVCQDTPFLPVDGARITPDSAFDKLYRCGTAAGTTATSDHDRLGREQQDGRRRDRGGGLVRQHRRALRPVLPIRRDHDGLLESISRRRR